MLEVLGFKSLYQFAAHHQLPYATVKYQMRQGKCAWPQRKFGGNNKKSHPLYSTWKGMRQRCNDPGTKAYTNYGKRGIRVCPEWSDFWQFVTDMGPRPPGTTLDRVDNNGNYSAQNCRWSTVRDQSLNTRKTNMYPYVYRIDSSYIGKILVMGKQLYTARNPDAEQVAIDVNILRQEYAPWIL